MKIHLPRFNQFCLKGLLMLCLVVTLGSQSNLTAQDLTMVPEFYQLTIDDETTKKHGYQLTNNTSETIEWYWSMEIPDEFPAEWEVQLCDLNLCYGWGELESANVLPNPLDPGVTTNPEFQYVNVRSNGVAGSSFVIVNIFRDPERTDLLVSTSATTSTNELGEFVSYDLFPNPSVNGFQISNDEQVESITLTTVTGQRVLNQAHRSGDLVDTSALADGAYIVTMYNSDNQAIGNKRFVKAAGK